MTRALIITVAAIVSLCVLLSNSVSAHPAWGIVVDRNDQIYFSDIETIWKIDAQGKLSVFRAGVSGRHTHELAIDDAGNLYGEDVAYESSTQRWKVALWKMTPAGAFSYVMAPTYYPPNGTSIWKDHDGNTYLAAQSNNAAHETLLLKRTPKGSVTTLIGSRKAVGAYRQVVLSSLGGMAFGTDGTVYFTDNSNIRKITPDGKATMLAHDLALDNPSASTMPESTVTRLFGIAVDAQGTAFVADYGNRRILKVTSGGAVSTIARAEQPWSPTGVALKDGILYILEFGFTPPGTYTPRVRKLPPDGKIVVLATAGENANPSAGETTPGVSSEKTAEPTRSTPYVLLGTGVSIFALTVVIWRVRKRISSHQH